MGERDRVRAAALAVASAGILLGHRLAYLADVPHAQARAAELARTGHGYLAIAGELVTVFMAFTLAALFLGRLIRPEGTIPARSTLILRLGTLQAAAFVAMEVIERLAAGSGFRDLTHGRLLPFGIALQLAVAVVGALLLRLFLRAADRVAAALPSPFPLPRPGTVSRALPPVPVRRARRAVATVGVRGPPSPVCG